MIANQIRHKKYKEDKPMQKPKLILSEQDLNRLQTMLDNQHALSPTMERLEDELARADVLKPEDVPNNVVTMNAKVRIHLSGVKNASEVTLVYPHEFKGAEGQVNVIAPIGAAILGLAEGQSIEWPQPDGQMMKVSIEKVLFQPEREGDYR